jgi:hypothetical protein
MGATTSGRGPTAATTDDDPMAKIASSARQAADTVAGAAGEVAARFPEAATTTREALVEANRAFREANRIVRASEDETLKVVGAASLAFCREGTSRAKHLEPNTSSQTPRATDGRFGPTALRVAVAHTFLLKRS